VVPSSAAAGYRQGNLAFGSGDIAEPAPRQGCASSSMHAERFDLIVRDGTIVTPERAIVSGTLAVQRGTIALAGRYSADQLRAAAVLDARGCWVVPGLIDLHIHGAGGHDAAQGALSGLSAVLAAHGVTAFLPTLLPEPPARLAATVAAVAALLAQAMPGAVPLGLHLEGPFLSPCQPGCLDASDLRDPDLAELDDLVAAARGRVKRMTLAVELPGALALLAALPARGILPSLGHSAASYEEVLRAIDRGLRHATHAFNAMAGFHHRAPGAAGAVLLRDEITAELIADGQHVHAAAVTLLHRLKGPARIALVSDAVPAAGLPQGTYRWAGQDLLADGSSCRTSEGVLAGSALMLDGALRFLLNETAIPVIDALQMAATTPASALGVADRKGSIVPGKDADLAIFDDQWRCRATIVAGRIVWKDGL
jgi:N-acetylglucosamine-6-phosphate deacetylase